MKKHELRNYCKHFKKYCDFNHELYEDNIVRTIVQPLQNNCKEYESYETGATKLVLYFKDCDFVIKIPFSCYTEEDSLKELTNAYSFNEDKNEWDYCKAENFIYKEAENKDLSRIFLKNERIGIIGKFPIYAQKKAIPYWTWQNNHPGIKTEITKHISELLSNYTLGFQEPYWLADAVKQYSYPFVEKLLSF